MSMRYLRSSLYLHPNEPPMTTVVAESDTIDTLESIRHQHLQPGALVVHEIFESDEPLELATIAGMRRQQANAEQEGHQAMLYYWTVMEWTRVSERGMVLMDKPAPLSREEIVIVFDQLRQHPDYGHRTIITHDRSGARVRMVDGEIKED